MRLTAASVLSATVFGMRNSIFCPGTPQVAGSGLESLTQASDASQAAGQAGAQSSAQAQAQLLAQYQAQLQAQGQAQAQAQAQAQGQAGAGQGQVNSGSLPLNTNQYTAAGYVASVAPLMSRAWHSPSGFQTAHLANGMTMNVPIDLPSTAVYSPTGAPGGAVGGVMGSMPGLPAGVSGHAMSALDPELAYVQQQQLAEKARVAQEIQALQYEAAMRARDVAMSNMGVHVAEQRLSHAQQLAHAVHARLAAAQRQLAALDVAQRRAADQSQLNQLQAALAEASASEAALTGARAGHQSLVHALQASIKSASSRVDAATGAIETILAGQGDKPNEIHGSNGVTSDISSTLHKQFDMSRSRAMEIAKFQRTLSNAVPSAADLVTQAHDSITEAGEHARAEAASDALSDTSDKEGGPAASAGTHGSGADAEEEEEEDNEDEPALLQTQSATARNLGKIS